MKAKSIILFGTILTFYSREAESLMLGLDGKPFTWPPEPERIILEEIVEEIPRGVVERGIGLCDVNWATLGDETTYTSISLNLMEGETFSFGLKYLEKVVGVPPYTLAALEQELVKTFSYHPLDLPLEKGGTLSLKYYGENCQDLPLPRVLVGTIMDVEIRYSTESHYTSMGIKEEEVVWYTTITLDTVLNGTREVDLPGIRVANPSDEVLLYGAEGIFNAGVIEATELDYLEVVLPDGPIQIYNKSLLDKIR